MHINIAVFVVLTLLTLASCIDNKQESNIRSISIREKPIFSKTPIKSLLDSLRPVVRRFEINGKIDTIISNLNGTSIAIDAYTFINSRGDVIEGEIQLEVVESVSYASMIGAQLSTLSNERILQTGGMIYINASSNNESLTIDNDKSITIDLESSYPFLDAKIFQGSFNSNSNINWASEAEIDRSFFTVPSQLLDINYGSWECYYDDELVEKLNDEKFKDSYISTREFEYRMNVFSTSSCDWMNGLDDEIIQIYTSNIDGNLYYSDSLVAAHIMLKFGDKIDTTSTEKFDFSTSMWQTYIYQSALDFYNQRLKQPINFEELGINDSTKTIDLTKKGFSVNEATKLVNLFKIRKKTIRSRRSENEVRALRSYTFSVTELGWVNVDRFLEDSNAKETDFKVEIESRDSLDYISIQLIIPSYSIVLSASEIDVNNYSFTKKMDGYRKVPVGQEAIIVALSMKGQIPYFGTKKIKIPSSGNISVELHPNTSKNIRVELSKIDG